MSRFLEYIASRRSDIKAQIAALKAEMRELEIAELAVAGGSSSEGKVDSSAKTTIKDYVMAVLSENSGGLDSAGIIKQVYEKFAITIKRPSLSPQLTRLKEDRRVVLDGTIWRIAEKNEPPSGSTLGGSTNGADEFF